MCICHKFMLVYVYTVYIYVYICIHMWISDYMAICVCVQVFVWVCTCLYAICMNKYVCVHVCMHMLYMYFIHVSYAHVCPVCMCMFMWRKNASWTWLGLYLHWMQLPWVRPASGRKLEWAEVSCQTVMTRISAQPWLPCCCSMSCEGVSTLWLPGSKLGNANVHRVKEQQKGWREQGFTWLCHHSRLTTCLL